MNPTTANLRGDTNLRLNYADDEGLAKLQKAIYFPGTKKVAVWNGHEFEVVEVLESIQGWANPKRISDVAGATRAYPNDDNTGWLFAHADQGTHHDYELTLAAALDGIMQPLFRQVQVDLLNPNNSNPTTERLRGQFTLLSSFYGECLADVRNRARSVWLGFRQQNPHPATGYLDSDLTESVNAVELKWKESRPADLAKLTSSITYLKNSLTMPSPETRWDMAARLAAEAKAKEQDEAESQDDAQGDGS